MSEAKVTILGCGSAKPTKTTSPSGQLVELCDKSFLVDCGEGVLLTMQRLGVHTGRLYNIFISHLHGDHCFGLIGLLTTLGMLKRAQPMHIYAHPDLEKLLTPLLNYHANDRLYDIIFHPINPRKHEVIFEDRTVSVETIPLKHGVPTCGFLFKETHRVKHEDGTFSYETKKRYAYCSDTAPFPREAGWLRGTSVIYHETTYLQELADQASQRGHSTTLEAARVALEAGAGKLLIGHYSSRCTDTAAYEAECRSVFPESFATSDGDVYDI